MLGRSKSSGAFPQPWEAVGAVAVVLLLGLVNMLRGGSANTSQRLMRRFGPRTRHRGRNPADRQHSDR